jgi:hypothetical protein
MQQKLKINAFSFGCLVPFKNNSVAGFQSVLMRVGTFSDDMMTTSMSLSVADSLTRLSNSYPVILGTTAFLLWLAFGAGDDAIDAGAAAVVAIAKTDGTNAVAIGPRVRCLRPSASRTPSPLARSPRERRCRSFLVERRRRSPALGRHRCWPPGSPALARPREPPPPLKPNPWRCVGVFIVTAWDWITASAWVGSWTLCT